MNHFQTLRVFQIEFLVLTVFRILLITWVLHNKHTPEVYQDITEPEVVSMG